MIFTYVDLVIGLGLTILGALIWMQNTAWMVDEGNTLPILFALPAFVWAGWPWGFRTEPTSFSKPIIGMGTLSFLLGAFGNMTFLMALGWTLFLFAWLKSRLNEKSTATAIKLLILPLLAFPWIALDADSIGWWFRLSGAWATATFYTLLGFQVTQAGTFLDINQTIISVEAACAGLNTLQSMLIAGTLVNYFLLGNTNRYWFNFPVLVAIAWFANTVRIIAISAVALLFGPVFAMGSFHLWGGWFILFVMFTLSLSLFYLQIPEKKEGDHAL